MNPILQKLELYGIIPVVVLNDANDAPPLGRVLSDCGLPCAEVTFRTAAAAQAIQMMRDSTPEVDVGAGTVLTIEQVKAAVGAGASFIVAPGFNRTIVEYCLAQNIPILPGVSTPSEIETALGYGLEAVKFFPAEPLGGLEYLKAMSAPYKGIRFVPTGGISPKNLLSYLKFPRVLACGGSWMVPGELIDGKKFDEIGRLTEEAVRLMLGFELRHVGINGASDTGAQCDAESMGELLDLPVKTGASSIFVGTMFEFIKKKGLGEHGHIAIGTHFPNRAKAYLERRGFGFRPETVFEKDGKLVTVYLEKEIAGFALHLIQL